MKKRLQLLTFIALSSFLILGCSEEKDDFSSDTLDEYLSLAPGKYITYRLDSTKFLNFGQTETVISYQAKDVVDAAITDNTGRPAWRIIRYLRDTAGLQPWKVINTYMIVATREGVEVVENNLRFQKLKLPLKEGFAWKGNSFIDTYSIHSDVRYLDDWDYMYEKAGEPFTLFTKTIPDTYTVNQRDEILGTPNNVDAYSERNFSTEVYAKNIGLVYKEFVHWLFQPRNSTYPNGYKEGYGLKLRMIDHN